MSLNNDAQPHGILQMDFSGKMMFCKLDDCLDSAFCQIIGRCYQQEQKISGEVEASEIHFRTK